MNEVERQILAALRELRGAVAGMATAKEKPNLAALFARIDALRGQLPKISDPNLLHYLHKQSYEKAELWLEGRDAENTVGSCRH